MILWTNMIQEKVGWVSSKGFISLKAETFNLKTRKKFKNCQLEVLVIMIEFDIRKFAIHIACCKIRYF